MRWRTGVAEAFEQMMPQHQPTHPGSLKDMDARHPSAELDHAAHSSTARAYAVKQDDEQKQSRQFLPHASQTLLP